MICCEHHKKQTTRRHVCGCGLSRLVGQLRSQLCGMAKSSQFGHSRARPRVPQVDFVTSFCRSAPLGSQQRHMYVCGRELSRLVGELRSQCCGMAKSSNCAIRGSLQFVKNRVFGPPWAPEMKPGKTKGNVTHTIVYTAQNNSPMTSYY